MSLVRSLTATLLANFASTLLGTFIVLLFGALGDAIPLDVVFSQRLFAEVSLVLAYLVVSIAVNTVIEIPVIRALRPETDWRDPAQIAFHDFFYSWRYYRGVAIANLFSVIVGLIVGAFWLGVL